MGHPICLSHSINLTGPKLTSFSNRRLTTTTENQMCQALKLDTNFSHPINQPLFSWLGFYWVGYTSTDQIEEYKENKYESHSLYRVRTTGCCSKA